MEVSQQFGGYNPYEEENEELRQKQLQLKIVCGSHFAVEKEAIGWQQVNLGVKLKINSNFFTGVKKHHSTQSIYMPGRRMVSTPRVKHSRNEMLSPVAAIHYISKENYKSRTPLEAAICSSCPTDGSLTFKIREQSEKQSQKKQVKSEECLNQDIRQEYFTPVTWSKQDPTVRQGTRGDVDEYEYKFYMSSFENPNKLLERLRSVAKTYGIVVGSLKIV